MRPARLARLLGVTLLVGGCGDEPADTFPRGRYVITEASDERFEGATVEVEGQRMLIYYTDAGGVTYRVKYDASGR